MARRRSKQTSKSTSSTTSSTRNSSSREGRTGRLSPLNKSNKPNQSTTFIISFFVVALLSLLLYKSKRTSNGKGTANLAPVYRVSIVSKTPHNIDSFTQGLAYDDDEPDVLYESTGLYGKSRVSRVHLRNGSAFKTAENNPADFGEGLTFYGAGKTQLVQVLWKSGKGHVFDRYTLEHLYSFEATSLKDGWGIAQVPEKPNCFYLTDGTDRICIFELLPNIRKAHVIAEIHVKHGEHPVGMLNEIEVVGDEIWSNILFAEVVVKINRHSGVVSGYLDLRQILHKSDVSPSHKLDVLNGIAYNFKSGVAYVTGKLWPKVIAVRPQEAPYAADLKEAGIDPFFLQPEKVRYIFEQMLA